jgi:hypothetical protein
MTLRKALDRTLLLMRDHVSDAASDYPLLNALTNTKICIATDKRNIRSNSAQSAFITLTLLLARSGHQVYLEAPNIALAGNQPPLRDGNLLEGLMTVGKDLLPERQIKLGIPKRPDLVFLLGDTLWRGKSRPIVRLNANAWGGRISRFSGRQWADEDWPIGGMISATLAAAEAYKSSMRRLRAHARDFDFFDEQYAPTSAVGIDVAPSASVKVSDLGSVDFISGGAISNAILYVFLRLPNLRGQARIIEDETSVLSNMNRCMLFLRSKLNQSKAVDLCSYSTAQFPMIPELQRFNSKTARELAPLANAVIVGVDHIPSRWDVQKTWPPWLGIGATSHFSAMASFHTPAISCAGCAHPVDDELLGNIPTISFVSFWADIWTAALYLRFLGKDRGLNVDQQFYFTPLRPEVLYHAPLPRRADCPINCETIFAKRAG